MKILTYNIRDLGCSEKCNEIRELIHKHGVDFCLIQESKKEHIDENFCRILWGGRGQFNWAFRESLGRAGGIVSLWDADKFLVKSQWHMEGAVVVNGLWGQGRQQCCIINVYAPCPLAERLELWDRLRYVVLQNQDVRICMAGDFNSICRDGERIGRRACSNRNDTESFDFFIRDSGLIDLPLHGRSYT